MGIPGLGVRDHAESRDLAAAGGYVGKTSGAEAREEPGELAAEEIGGEVNEHIFELDVSWDDIWDAGEALPSAVALSVE